MSLFIQLKEASIRKACKVCKYKSTLKQPRFAPDHIQVIRHTISQEGMLSSMSYRTNTHHQEQPPESLSLATTKSTKQALMERYGRQATYPTPTELEAIQIPWESAWQVKSRTVQNAKFRPTILPGS